MAHKKILVVEDEAHIAELIGDIIAMLDREVLLAFRGSEAVQFIDQHPLDCVVMDITLPDMNGLQLYHHICSRYPHLSHRFVFMSGAEPDEDLEKLLESSENKFIHKPFQVVEFKAVIESLLKQIGE